MLEKWIEEVRYTSRTEDLIDWMEDIVKYEENKSRTKKAEYNFIKKLYKKFSEVNYYGFTEKEFIKFYYIACMNVCING